MSCGSADSETLGVMKLQQLRSSGFIFRSLSPDLIQAPQGLANKPPEDPPQSSEQTKTPV